MRCRVLGFACVLVIALATALPVPVHAQAPSQNMPGRISGAVVDADGHLLPGAIVTLMAGEVAVAATATTETGAFEFNDLAAGPYALVAELTGYTRREHPPVHVIAGQSLRVRILLEVAPVAEVVTVVGATRAGAPLEGDEIRSALLRVFQLPADRFQAALPLLPGVIRDPRGRLSFNGTRPSQSTLLVNGTNATDPVTGQFAFELPLTVVDTVEVHAIPYSAEYGRVSGAVANVRTLSGDDHWDVDFGGLFPDPRFRNGTLVGINKITPHVRVSGPLRQGTAWLSQAFSYRFVRSRVKAEIPGDDEEVLHGFDSFTQIDVQLNDRHSFTATVSVFPTEVDNVGIDTLTLADATPDSKNRGWNMAFADVLATGPTTAWQTQMALRKFDVAVRPKGPGPAQLTPDGLRQNYFNEIDRHSRQFEFGVARLQSWRWGTQQHLFKVGGQVLATSFDGIDRSRPIEARGANGRLIRRITFQGSGELQASDVITSAYLQDHWQVSPRLALDLGLRYDHDSMIGESHFSPRAAFSLSLDDEGRTIVKGGWGLFFDQSFLQIDAFRQFQQRVEQEFDGLTDTATGPPVVFENRVVPGEFEEPTSLVWNLEFDRQIGESLLVRVNYRENRATHRPVIERVAHDAGAALELSSTGELTAREFDATVRWTLGERGTLFVSFSKMRTSADLNDFGVIYDNYRDPLVLDNEVSLQPFDVPNRVLLWGVLTLPKGITVTPGIEWRSGFPYSVHAEDYSVVGEQNRSRFPHFFSADVGVTKQLSLFGTELRVGVQAYNLTSHHNPRDVVSNIASAAFGEFRNSVGSSFGLKLDLGW